MVKGQLKIQQMAFMLLAVTLFLVLAGMFILVIKVSGMREQATALAEKNAILLVTKLANSPEFSCGESFDELKLSCIDADKVMVLKENIENYEGFWGGGVNIEIIKIYPKEDEIECELGNTYPNCNVINLIGEPISAEYSNFALLCRKADEGGETYNKCEIAKIMVSYEDLR